MIDLAALRRAASSPELGSHLSVPRSLIGELLREVETPGTVTVINHDVEATRLALMIGAVAQVATA